MEESEDSDNSDDPLSASTSGLFLFFSSSLSVTVNAECLHNLALKPKPKKKRCTRNIMMSFLEKKHDRSMQYKEDALEVEKRRLDAMEKQVDVMRDILCHLVKKTEQ